MDKHTKGIPGFLRPNRYEMIFLIVSTVVPYCILFWQLSSVPAGVHGTLYPERNAAILDGLGFDEGYGSSEGWLNGTVIIDKSHGWLFCNGHVQPGGTYQIDNAELQYTASPYRTSPHDFIDPATIHLKGEKGDLRTGAPFWAFSLIVVPFGILAFFTWKMVRTVGLKSHPFAWWAIFTIYVITQLAIFFYEINITVITWIFLGVSMVFFFYLRTSKKKFLGLLAKTGGVVPASRLYRFPLFYSLTGFLLFCWNGLFLNPQFFEYIVTALYLSSIPMAWGIGAVFEIRAGVRKENSPH